MKKHRGLLLLLCAVLLLLISVPITVSVNSDNEAVKEGSNDKADAEWVNPFADVKADDWFYDSVKYVFENQLMNGVSETEFAPEDVLTRAMLVTILHRSEGEPTVNADTDFADVAAGAYYEKAVAWAAENSIVSGYDETTFGPEDAITREQIAAVFYRYAAYKKYDVSNKAELTRYEDFEEISDYAVEALNWANACDVITGTSADTLSPSGYATRCQVAAILRRFNDRFVIKEKVEEGNAENSAATASPHYLGAGGGSSEDDENERYEPEDNYVQQPIIKVNTVYGKPGDMVSVDLDLEKNPGILGMILSLEYDETAMRLLGAENGEAVADVLTLTPSNTLNSGVRFVWDGLDLSQDEIKDGTLLTLEFELLDNVTVGKRYPLMLKYNPGDIVDTELNEVSPSIYQGYIEIEEIEEEF